MSHACMQSFWNAVLPGPPSNPAQSQHNNQDDSRPRWFFCYWRLLLLTFIALLQVFAWIALGIYHLVSDQDDFRSAFSSIMIGVMWLYNLLKPAVCPRYTAYIDLFVLYTILLGFGVIRVGISTYLYYIGAASLTNLEWISMSLDLMAITAGLGYVRRSPEDYASIFEWATYSWVYPLIKLGNTREMRPENVWDLTPAMQSEVIFAKFRDTKGETLGRRLWVANFNDLCLDVFLTMVTVQILYMIENPTREGRSNAYALALIGFVCTGEADAQHLFFGRRASVRVSTQLMNAIYDKALKRTGVTMQEPAFETGPAVALPDSNHPKREASDGKIVSLMAIDASKVSAIVASAYLLYGAYAGLVVMLGAWALHICIAQRQVCSRRELSASRDRRMSVLYELINAVRFIKFFSLENHWIKRVQDGRCVEMDLLERFRMKSVLSATYPSFPLFVYVDQGYQLTPSVVFTVRLDIPVQPLNVFPNFLVQVFEARLSLERIEAFLREEELSDHVSSPSGCSVETGDTIAICKGRFKWRKVSNETINPSPEPHALQPTNRFELRDISVCFPKGKLSLVKGPTGCGKTALLLALLGQMTMIEGRLIKPRDMSNAGGSPNLAAISYAAQTPWLHSGTIKENILFGSQYDEGRYDDVVERCALRPDLNQLPEGDQTQVGDRGVNLSGGQKARIALARAVYAQTQYVLLDDPFSAIDTQTSRYLYERLFCGPLLEGRTVILVTHYVELVLPKANYMVCMQDGQIITQSSVEDLRKKTRLPVKTHSARKAQDVRIHQRTSGESARVQIPDESPGGVEFSPYKTYGQKSPRWMRMTSVILVVMSQGIGVAEKLWIREWGQAYGNNQVGSSVWYNLSKRAFLDPVSNTCQQILGFLPDANHRPLFYVVIYALVAFIMTVLSVLSIILLYAAAQKASRSLFSLLLEGVVHASLPWHDTTPRGKEPALFRTHVSQSLPAGQILDRFSKDMRAIDVNLANDVATVSSASVNFVAAAITVLKLLRMESTSRPPIFSAFGELLDGIVTIQAFRSTHRFLEEYHRKVDVANKMYYNSWMTNRWLLFNYDVLGACAVLATTILALSERVDAGTAGLCMTSAMLFTLSMYLVCRFGASLQLELNAIERVAEYLNIPNDPPAVDQSNRSPYLPSNLSMQNLFVKYPSCSEPVLKDVTFTLNAPERIAIVGRTGSGRSTLINSMLRFINPVRGRVTIGGIDISEIGIRDLRSRIDAGLFSGTLRENVDPFHQYEDDDCLDALCRVNHAWHGSITLDTQVAPAGANFSVGERRLIPMARALLRRDPIVILDEATSSVDFATDAAIQEILRKEFRKSLLINVAHRLSTVVDYDRVIVLEDGQTGGVFREMCLNSESYAEIEAAILREMKETREAQQS
ncbi:multidrug resistance-associated ABC transporter [Pisolithus orientalis]|uniref:multidrug resistance-associated ABC transporter n=1 Tax=Pisolithus orientalis TaxID=936130 RepID=UPI002224313C|nr:multidrug resistance-associated ABC transporter [Pisolithus orientalis]KAI6003480.1 multidrug resistance-associated ABC transporter [Pisolithus orientalis]